MYFFKHVVDPVFALFLSAPAGCMLRRTGIRLHGHEFVVYHRRLGDWRVSERRRTLAATTERTNYAQNANQSSPCH